MINGWILDKAVSHVLKPDDEPWEISVLAEPRPMVEYNNERLEVFGYDPFYGEGEFVELLLLRPKLGWPASEMYSVKLPPGMYWWTGSELKETTTPCPMT